jgi:hypothetical protein
MSTTTTSASGSEATLEANLGTQVSKALSSADSTTATRTKLLGLVQQARLAQLTRTAASVTAQYGKNSKEAKAAEASVSASQATVTLLAAATRQVTTPAPQVAASGWALHGRVYNSQLQPTESYTVFLVDSQNTYQSAYGFAYTDSTGYFLLNFSGTPAAQNQQQPQASQQAGQPATTATSQATAQATAGLYIEIANSKGQPVYLAKTPFAPATGLATYQNVTLPAGEKPIGDPPESIRKGALPPAKQST